MRNIIFNKKKYRTVSFKISPRADFKTILDMFNDITLTWSDHELDNYNYAVLELVNNSLRAHRVHRDERPIIVNYSVGESGLKIIVKDKGGGFDPSILPYDLYSPLPDIDLNDEAFQEYRERNHYQRFGMGLYLSKRTFPFFSLIFVNDQDKEVLWGSEDLVGTIVSLETNND